MGNQSQFIEMFGDPVENEKGWPLVRLDELAEIKIGPFGSLLHKEDYIENGHALVNPSHIVDSKIVIDPKLTISDEKYDELSSYALRIGDVVLGRRGEMGRCAVVYEEGLVCGTGSMIIRPGTEMKPYFLQNIISSPAYRRVIEGKAVGVTMMNLNAPTVSSFMIPKLPVKLQEEYLEFVNQSDKSKFVVSNRNLSRCSVTWSRIRRAGESPHLGLSVITSKMAHTSHRHILMIRMEYHSSRQGTLLMGMGLTGVQQSIFPKPIICNASRNASPKRVISCIQRAGQQE